MAEKESPNGKPAADVVLGDGREIRFDLMKITKREYDSLFDRNQPDDEEAVILAKVSGLKPEDIDELPLLDWKRFMQGFYKRVSDPVTEDPKN
jgi:hypothetical protein